jgi:hypothetical protein
MKLTDLSARLIRREERTETWTRVLGNPLAWKPGDPTEQVTGPREYHVPAATLAEAQGVMYLCPKCHDHSVLCWFSGRDVPDSAVPGPGRWQAVGTGLHDLTFGPGPSGRSSVQLTGGCNAHFNVVNGEIRDLT